MDLSFYAHKKNAHIKLCFKIKLGQDSNDTTNTFKNYCLSPLPCLRISSNGSGTYVGSTCYCGKNAGTFRDRRIVNVCKCTYYVCTVRQPIY